MRLLFGHMKHPTHWSITLMTGIDHECIMTLAQRETYAHVLGLRIENNPLMWITTDRESSG
jgi:hypothetical protein